jgi:ABC-2 type transport system ATP-binding protein
MLEGFRITPIDETTIEVESDKSHSCNLLFEHFSRHNIHVKSLRNKSNRLEQLFLHLVTDSEARVGAVKNHDAA